MRIERTKNAGRNMVFGTLMRIYQIVMPFVIRTFMIRYMGAAYTGLSGLFTSILHVLNLAELGVGSAMVYSMYQAIAEDNHDEICALMRLYRRYYRIIGIVVLVVGLAIMPLLPVLVNKDVPADISINTLYLMNLAYTVASYWLFAYRSSLVQAYQRNDIISKVTICANTIMCALQLAAIILFDNYYGYTSSRPSPAAGCILSTGLKANCLPRRSRPSTTASATSSRPRSVPWCSIPVTRSSSRRSSVSRCSPSTRTTTMSSRPSRCSSRCSSRRS